MERARDGLLARSPDVIALQEVGDLDVGTQAHWLGDELALHVTYHVSWTASERREGLALLTRRRPTAQRVWPLPLAERDPQRILQVVKLADPVSGADITVANTHLAFRVHDEEGRRLQAEFIRSKLGEDMSRTILCGDFNSTPDGVAARVLIGGDRGFVDAAVASGDEPGPTFARENDWALDALSPGRRVDYVLVGGALRTRTYSLAFTSQADRVSDHYAVVVDVDTSSQR